jgi:hypothetical protein
MKFTLLTLLVFSVYCSTGQTVHTRLLSKVPVQWIKEEEKYKKDSTQFTFGTMNPKVIMAYDVIQIITDDTSRIYLNANPKEMEDSVVINRMWEDANDESGRECLAMLYYFKEDKYYKLRILYLDTDSGAEYYLRPLKIDIIPRNEQLP